VQKEIFCVTIQHKKWNFHLSCQTKKANKKEKGRAETEKGNQFSSWLRMAKNWYSSLLPLSKIWKFPLHHLPNLQILK